jgi:hypothetical protein
MLRHFWVDGTRAERPTYYLPGQSAAHPAKAINATNTTSTTMYPLGSQFDFTGTGLDPSSWKNPQDVEFVFTACAAYNCWVEPRCAVESVKGSLVSLQQSSGNSSCFHRLYYFGIGWGGKETPDRPAKPPTSIENVFHNFTGSVHTHTLYFHTRYHPLQSGRGQRDTHSYIIPAYTIHHTLSEPGQFYYDRQGGTIAYIPREGETAATLEATATTATAQLILAVNNTKNIIFDGTAFQYATWLGAGGPKGFVDTQVYRD